MSFLDIMIIALVLAFTLVSAAWGVIRQAIAVGGLILGLILAANLSDSFSKVLGFINNPQVARGIAFILIVVIISMIASAVATVLYFVSGLLFLGLADHLLGAFLGFVQGLLAVGILLIAGLLIFPEWMNQQLSASVIANKLVKPISDLALLVAPQDLKDLISAQLPKV